MSVEKIIQEINEKLDELQNEKKETIYNLRKNISNHKDYWEAEGYIFLVAKQLKDKGREIDDLIRTRNLLSVCNEL